MKKFLYLGMASLAFGLFSCSGDDNGGSAMNPNDVADEFANPTGTLTNENANDVANAGADAETTGGLNDPFSADFTGLSASNAPSHTNKYPVPYYGLEEGDIDACVETTETASTVDWECVFNLDDADECTGDGTSTISSDTSEGFYTVSYDGFSLDCGDADSQISCDGEINISADAAGLYCSNLSCTFGGETHAFDGCVNAEGEFLVNVDGESFVLGDIVLTCETVTFSVRDSVGDHSVTCDVTFSGECEGEGSGDVDTITGCTIAE